MYLHTTIFSTFLCEVGRESVCQKTCSRLGKSFEVMSGKVSACDEVAAIEGEMDLDHAPFAWSSLHWHSTELTTRSNTLAACTLLVARLLCSITPNLLSSAFITSSRHLGSLSV